MDKVELLGMGFHEDEEVGNADEEEQVWEKDS